MKRLFALTGFLCFLASVYANSTAQAADVALSLNCPQNAIQGQEITATIDATALGQTRNIAGAVLTVSYNPAIVTFVQATSAFFGTFTAQGITPASVVVDGVTYAKPMVVNSQTSGTVQLAAALAQAKPLTTTTKITLFQLRFTVNQNATIGSSTLSLRQSRISNTDAGYSASGETVPVLLGATDTGTYPPFTASLTPLALRIFDDNDIDGDGIANADETTYGTSSAKADTDGDGLNDYAEIFTHHTDPLKADTDGDGTLDGHEIKEGTSPTDPNITAPLVLETGTLQVNHLWQSVTYANSATYSRPVVVAKAASNKGAVSLIIQIKDVTATGFKIRLKETSTLNTPGDEHVKEDVGYMVMEAGSFLYNGVRINAGVLSVAQTVAGQTRLCTFPVASTKLPVVMASVTSAKLEDVPVNVRVISVAKTGFTLLLQEEEKLDQIHAAEDVSYIAWDPSLTIADNYVIEAGRKATVVDHQPYAFLFSRPFSTVPALLADMQTAVDKEPATLRYTLLSPTGATVYVSEDKSKDTEVLHAKESLGYIALAPATTTDTDGDGLTDEQEQYVYHTNPSLQDTDDDGLTDNLEVLTHHTDPVKVDTDGDGAWDGHEIKDGTNPLDPAETATLVLETGSLKINHLWKQVTYLNGATYSRPVVIAKPASNKGPVSVIVQIKDVTATGFKIRLQETSTMGTPGDDHVLEDIGYMVTEAGSFLVNGVRVTAGRVAVIQETAGLMKVTPFTVPMSVAPVVLASVTTANEENTPVHVRVGNPTTNGFSRMLQEEEVADQIHGEETVSYIAWEPGLITTQGSVIEVGRQPTAVGNAPYALTFSAPKATVPVLLADMQSAVGREPATLRYTTLSTTGATLYVSEDKSLDTEVVHPKETLGYIAISPEQ